MMSLTDQLRKAIDDSGLSLYAVAKATHTPYAVIHGFANGHRDIKLETADKLAELFKMKLTAAKRPKKIRRRGRKVRTKKGGESWQVSLVTRLGGEPCNSSVPTANAARSGWVRFPRKRPKPLGATSSNSTAQRLSPGRSYPTQTARWVKGP